MKRKHDGRGSIVCVSDGVIVVFCTFLFKAHLRRLFTSTLVSTIDRLLFITYCSLLDLAPQFRLSGFVRLRPQDYLQERGDENG